MSQVPVVSTQASLSAILSTLAHVAAPEVLVHVGAGDGRGSTHLWHAWQVPRAVLIDADGSRLAWAEKAFQAKSGESPTKGFVALEGLVSKSGAEAIFNVCSHPGESGLLEPKALTPLWANLSLLEAKLQQTVTLDDLLSHSVQAMEYLTAIDNGWLIVDCFPGANILTGASELLAKTQVVCVRVIADVVSDDRLDAAKADAVDPILQAAGFEQVAAIADLHPSIVYAVYSKPVASMLQEKLKIAQVQAAKAKEQYEAMHVEWEKAIAAKEAELATEVKSREQQQAAEANLAEQVSKLKSDLDSRTKASQLHEQALKNLQAEREQAIADKAAVGKQLAEKDAQLATAVKTNEQQKPALAESDRLRLEAQSALKTAQAETQKLKTTLQEETQRIERLTAENQELAHRQQLMNEELVKAEGQITLIKDLLLREPGI